MAAKCVYDSRSYAASVSGVEILFRDSLADDKVRTKYERIRHEWELFSAREWSILTSESTIPIRLEADYSPSYFILRVKFFFTSAPESIPNFRNEASHISSLVYGNLGCAMFEISITGNKREALHECLWRCSNQTTFHVPFFICAQEEERF